MKFLFASDSFKGTVSSARIAELLTLAAHEYIPDCETVGIAIADGGEGTVNAVLHSTGGALRTIIVHNPLMENVEASYGIYTLEDGIHKGAIIEMSAASGITLIPGEKLNPLYTTTYGTGELIKDALNQGCTSIAIAIGGSATDDGGIGALRALGARFLDSDGAEIGFDSEGHDLGGCGKDLARICSIDVSQLIPEAGEAHFTVLCDVDNLLTGPDGATFTFGRQKCSETLSDDEINDILSELESGMCNYAQILNTVFHADPNSIPGTGAAGGLGAALSIILGAEMNSGIETVLRLINFDRLLKGVDLCITGEGRLDWQSSHGKTINGIANHCRRLEIPLVAIVGCTGEGFEDAYEIGISQIIRTSDKAPTLEDSIAEADRYYLETARDFFKAYASNQE